jgi:RNase P subunit RPR2
MEKTEEIPVKATTCPKCYDEVEPGLKFCTKMRNRNQTHSKCRPSNYLP